MKSLIINIIFIFFSSVAISQNNCDTLFCDSCLIYNPFIVKLKHINPNFNGSDSSYFLSSIDGKTKLKIIRDYKNGVLVHAIAKYNNDQIYEENYYNNGLNGIMRTFDTDGKLAGWSRWENGKAIIYLNTIFYIREIAGRKSPYFRPFAEIFAIARANSPVVFFGFFKCITTIMFR